MAAQQSKAERLIFSVTTSTGLGERSWSELLAPRRSTITLDEGIAASAVGEAWNPAIVVNPIGPETVR